MSWSFARLGCLDVPLLDALAAAAIARINDFGAQSMANTAWAFAKLGFPNMPLMKSISAASITRIDAFSGQQQSNIAWAFATLALHDPPLMNAISAAALRILTEYSTQNLTNTAWAFATLLCHDTPLLTAIASSARPSLRQFINQELANLSWSVSKLLFRHSPLMDSISEEFLNKIQEMDSMNISNMAWSFAVLGIEDETLLDSIAEQSLPKIPHCGAQELANTSWSFAALGYAHEPLIAAIAASSRRRICDFGKQNISNTAWAVSILAFRDLPLLDAISSAARPMISVFDTQGLANTAWSFASLKVEDRPLLDAIASAASRLISVKETRIASEQELHHLAFSVLAIAWAFAFSLMFDPSLRSTLWDCLLRLGRLADGTSSSLAMSRPSSATWAKLGCAEKLQLPQVLIQCPGMLVIYKPPGWEVDSVANETDAICLSMFLQQRFHRQSFPLLHSSAFGFGFIHRLDVASSGLVLVGCTFEGLFALQWQKNLYEIHREYQVVSHDLEPLLLRDVEARVNVMGSKIMRTLTEDNGQPAISHLLTEAHLAGGPSADFRYCIIVIQIYTGRRHQIRAHTRAIGHPTACDGWYAPSAVSVKLLDKTGPAPPRRWVRTPRWDGDLPPPPKELEGQVY